MEFSLFLYKWLVDNLRKCGRLFAQNLLYFSVLGVVMCVYIFAALNPQSEFLLFLALLGKMVAVATLMYTVWKKYDFSFVEFLRMGFVSFLILALASQVYVALM